MFNDTTKELNSDAIYDSYFLGKKVYNLTKAKDGLNTKRLSSLISLLTYSVSIMDDARMAHIKIEMPTDKLKNIGRFLATYATKYQLDKSTSHIGYALKYEVGVISKREHAHLYIFADGWETRDFLALERELEVKGYSAFTRTKRDRPVKLMRRSGEYVMSHESDSYHSLNSRFEDAFDRISYIAKVKTTSKLRKKPFSTSRIPKDLALAHSFE